MKGAIVHKICGYLNLDAKEIFLIVSQIYWEVMRNASFFLAIIIIIKIVIKFTRIEFLRYR